VLRFTDNGPGIPEENLDQLSEPFFTTKSKGTGLGLTITYSIVDAHGGQIEALSKEGEGATFIVTLPLLEQA
jgi:signal transduction histidine kinase